MKTIKIMSILFLGFVFTMSSMAMNKLSDKDMASVKKAVQEFVKNTDTRNVKGLEKTISERSTFVNTNAITNKTSEYNYDEYLSAIRNGKVGGWERQLEILNIDSHGNTAIAKVACKDPRMTSTGFVTLMKEGNDWKIISGAFYLDKNK
ncbi:MAG TPA: nuclear transport factor 2 family protein [Ignavibacteriaceae bacterium]|nr:nuclear transport factor 2 family protein [Ignavibacteriaceae bacterium]